MASKYMKKGSLLLITRKFKLNKNEYHFRSVETGTHKNKQKQPAQCACKEKETPIHIGGHVN